MDLVDAQQARRIVDRLVGYTLSPLLWRKVRGGLSAGRVQSVAVRLVVEREREIEAFQPREYWTLEAPRSRRRRADVRGRARADRRREAGDRRRGRRGSASGDALAGRLPRRRARSRRERPAQPGAAVHDQHPPAGGQPQAGLQPEADDAVAQRLYEGVELGRRPRRPDHLHAHRLDARSPARRWARRARSSRARFGDASTRCPRAGVHRTARRAPRRPTRRSGRPRFARDPDALAGHSQADELRLYRLDLAAGAGLPDGGEGARDDDRRARGRRYGLRASATRTRLRRLRARLHRGPTTTRRPRRRRGPLPPLAEGDAPRSTADVEPTQHFTEPPPRYTEATLIKALEEHGIGRPSTYAARSRPSSTAASTRAVERPAAGAEPSSAGIVTDLLVEHFGEIVDVAFTARMEEGSTRSARRAGWPVVCPSYRVLWPLRDAGRREAPRARRADFTTEATDEVCSQWGTPWSSGSAGRAASWPAPASPNAAIRSRSPRTRGRWWRRASATSAAPPWWCEAAASGDSSPARATRSARNRPLPVACVVPEEGCAGELTERRTRRTRLLRMLPLPRVQVRHLGSSRCGGPCAVCGSPCPWRRTSAARTRWSARGAGIARKWPRSARRQGGTCPPRPARSWWWGAALPVAKPPGRRPAGASTSASWRCAPRCGTPAHETSDLTELVYSNSLKSEGPETASGMLKRELRNWAARSSSPRARRACPRARRSRWTAGVSPRRSPARWRACPGSASCARSSLAWTRSGVAWRCWPPDRSPPRGWRTRWRNHRERVPLLLRRHLAHLPRRFARLRSPVPGEPLRKGRGGLLERAARRGRVSRAHRRARGGGDLSRPRLRAERFFRACQPVEELARSGPETLAHGPLRPVGLDDPRTGKRPHAVIQLRVENEHGTLLSPVGFQTRLRHGEQERVFRMLRGVRAGEVRAPRQHPPQHLRLRSPAGVQVPRAAHAAGDPPRGHAGRRGGIRGGHGLGWLAGQNAARAVLGEPLLQPPPESMIGALVHHLVNSDPRGFQPMT